MAFGKKNKISVNPLDYNVGLIGLAGVGKTTTIKEYCEILAPEEGGYLFIECGKESGVDAIQDINYINCPAWHADYDDLNNEVGIAELVEDIIENKNTEYPNLKVVVIDTIDQLKEIADAEIVRRYNKDNPDQPKKTSIKQVYGGFGAGSDMADQLIVETLWELKKVGVSFVVIGHIKQKDITDPVSGETYTQLTTDMTMRSFNAIKNKLDVLGVAYIKREIINKIEKEKIVGKGKKEKVEVGKVGSEARVISFRDDSYAIDSKSRFAHITDEIGLSGQELVDAIKDAIEAELTSKGSSMAEATKEQKVVAKQKAEAEKKYSEDKKSATTNAERSEELFDKIKNAALSMDSDTKAKIKEFLAANGLKNFKDKDAFTIDMLEEAAEILGVA